MSQASCFPAEPSPALAVLCWQGKGATHLDAGKSRLGLQYQARQVTPSRAVRSGRTGNNLRNRDNPQPTWLPDNLITAERFNARQGVGSSMLSMCLRYGLRPPEKVRPSTYLHRVEKWSGKLLSNTACRYHGTGLWQPSVHSDVAF